MKSFLLCSGLAALLAAAGPAQSAPPPSKETPAPSVDHVYWMVDCMTIAKSRDIQKALSTVPAPGGIEMHWFKGALQSNCLREDLPIPSANFYKRGAVAERFLYRDFPSIGGPARRVPAPVFAPVHADSVLKEPKVASALVMLEAASCLVRSDPRRTYDFFSLDRGSAEEAAMINEMAPALSQCLTKGDPIKLTAQIFRAFLAEAAYRVAAGQPEVFEGKF
jgi:hypothetical protein